MKEESSITAKDRAVYGMGGNLHQLQSRQRVNIQNSQRISEIKYQGNKTAINEWANELSSRYISKLKKKKRKRKENQMANNSF